MQISRELIRYIFFGIATTVVNILVYILLSSVLNTNLIVSNTCAWIISVIFAFITNKLFVFQNRFMNFKEDFLSFLNFILYRLLSYGVDLFLMIIFVNLLLTDDIISKILVNVVVILLNYLTSKFIVFRIK